MKKTIIILTLALSLLCACACFHNGAENSTSENASSFAESLSSEVNGEISSEEMSSREEITSGEEISSSEESAETEIGCLVQFDTDGAGEIASVRVKKGEKLTAPETPQKTSKECEYEFLGWFNGEREWDFEKDAVTEDMTLTAHWKEGGQYTNPFLPKD